jgi:hypothetical protein
MYMYVYILVSKYVYMFRHTYICTCIHILTYEWLIFQHHSYTNKYIYIYIYIYTYIYTSMGWHSRLLLNKCLYKCIHIHVYGYIVIFKHMWIYLRVTDFPASLTLNRSFTGVLFSVRAVSTDADFLTLVDDLLSTKGFFLRFISYCMLHIYLRGRD